MNWTRAKAIKLFGYLFITSSLLILLFVLEFAAQAIVAQMDDKNLSREALEFYKKHSQELNHLRRHDFLQTLELNEAGNIHQFIYSTIGTGSTEILIQGDSWGEQFLLTHQTRQDLAAHASDTDSKFILSGTTSYSPSLMSVQARKLTSEFGMQPKYVIAVIDQTDIGDELCRYKRYLDKNNKGELIVKPVTYDESEQEVFNLTRYFKYNDILKGDDFASIKLLKLAQVRAEYSYKKKFKRVRCSWTDISAPLSGELSDEDKNYFADRLDQYINQLFSIRSVEKVLFVTHFHRMHATGEYRKNVADLVSFAVSRSRFSDRISLLNIGPNDNGQDKLSEIFKEGDPASHLTKKYFSQFYARKVLETLDRVSASSLRIIETKTPTPPFSGAPPAQSPAR